MTENVVVNIVASRLSEQRLTAMPNTTAQYVLHIYGMIQFYATFSLKEVGYY